MNPANPMTPRASQEGTPNKDTARINWIEQMAADCEGHILTRLFIPDGKPFRDKVDAAMKLYPTNK